MMDYPTWKKKPKTPQFVAFNKACQLDAALKECSENAAAASTNATSTTALPVPVNSPAVGPSSVDADGQQHQQVPSSHQQRATASNVAATTSRTAAGTFASATTTTQHQRGAAATIAGTEIKIPGVGATPVAVSTTLPAAVVQLSQKGKAGLKRANSDRSTLHFSFLIGSVFGGSVFGFYSSLAHRFQVTDS